MDLPGYEYARRASAGDRVPASDERDVEVEFVETDGGVLVRETFDAETENPPELQRAGGQAIRDSFRRHVDAKS